jgi:hypothetical protein
MDAQKKLSGLTADLNQRPKLRTSQWRRRGDSYTQMLTVDEAAGLSQLSTNQAAQQTHAE